MYYKHHEFQLQIVDSSAINPICKYKKSFSDRQVWKLPTLFFLKRLPWTYFIKMRKQIIKKENRNQQKRIFDNRRSQRLVKFTDSFCLIKWGYSCWDDWPGSYRSLWDLTLNICLWNIKYCQTVVSIVHLVSRFCTWKNIQYSNKLQKYHLCVSGPWIMHLSST